jgi:hypothetical protein
MFFYRYKVAEPHLNKYACEMHAAFLAGKTEKNATVGKDIQIHKWFDREDKAWVYFALSMPLASTPHKVSRKPYAPILGFICLSKVPRWHVLETDIIYVNPNARGQGMATVLYDAVLKDGHIVMSGYSHNPKSRRLWMKLVQNPKYVTWAHDIINLDQYSDVWVDEDQFECNLKLYDDIKKIRRRMKSDVRILMFNPRYVNESTAV